MPIILNHFGRPAVLDGRPYEAAESLFELAPLESVYLKLTPRIFGDVKEALASADTFFPKLVDTFGSRRPAWGSNHPTSEGTLVANLDKAKASLKSLPADDKEWTFGKTAQTLHPGLAD